MPGFRGDIVFLGNDRIQRGPNVIDANTGQVIETQPPDPPHEPPPEIIYRPTNSDLKRMQMIGQKPNRRQ